MTRRAVSKRGSAVLEAGMEPIPGHRLLVRLGKGGFGDVWAAELRDGSIVALKFIDCRHHSSTLVANEVRVLLKLRQVCHPHIIRLLDVCASRQFLVLKMERADGNLRELHEVYMQETGQGIPCDHLLELMEQAADGLDFLAEQVRMGLSPGVMQHCDIKPSNLLIHEQGLRIVDFGLCMSSLAGTHGRRFMGTPPYAPPELHDGRVTDHTDQYSLAVTYSELVTNGRAMLPWRPGQKSWSEAVDINKIRSSEAPVLARALDVNWTNRFPN